MKTLMNGINLSSRGARVHFGIAVALISVIPSLTLFYLYSSSSGARPLTFAQWMVAALGIAGAMIFGYVLLGRYPATIIRLRSYLHNVAQGELPDDVDLATGEQDIIAIEQALNIVVGKLRTRLHETQKQKSRLEDELFRAQKLEAIGTLAAGIAHEINTPLQFVSNNTQFLNKACRDLLAGMEDRPDPAASQENGESKASARRSGKRDYFRTEGPRAFEQLDEGLSRIAEIVKAIRDFARGGADEARAPVDLNQAVQTTVEVTRNEWKYHADLETDLDPTLPPVPCFPGEIKRALMDLIVNAAQAIAAGRGQGNSAKGLIRITTSGNGTEVWVSVSDDGCGIPSDIRDRIFDPFFTTKEIGAGKGCGLSFAHAAIVRRHGGRLTFVTEEDKGTTFRVSLPRSVPSQKVEGSTEPPSRDHTIERDSP